MMKWITNHTSTPFYLRKSFEVSGIPVRAQAKICGLGQFNFYMNGKRVSDHVLDPVWTDYRKTVCYVVFDILDCLKCGKNALGIEVGNGWYIMDGEYYSFHFPPFMPPNPNPYRPFGKSLVAAAELKIEYEDGREEVIVSDDSFLSMPHAVAYSNVYGSERIDGGKYLGGSFSLPDFDDSAWEPAQAATQKEAPAGELTEQVMPAVKIIRSYDGTCISNPKENSYVYDLGQNMSGILEACVRGKAGTEVRFKCAEKLDEAGMPDQMAKGWMMIDSCITYIIGKDAEWEPFSQLFTYFAGRFFLVEADAPFEVDWLKGHAISSAWKEAGSFCCDDERYNKIYDMIERTVEANMVGVHTDCPTIERFAWQEPNHLMAPSIMFMKDGSGLWRKFLKDCRDAQHTADDVFYDFEGRAFPAGDGLVPSQAPCYIPNVLPVPGMGSFYDIIAWGSTIILGTWWHYTFYGDKSILEENYDAGMRYLKHLQGMVTPDGFIGHGLGDWGNPDALYLRENIETVFLYADADTLAKMAEVLGKTDDAVDLAAYAEDVRNHYNEKLLRKNRDGRWYYQAWEGCAEVRKAEEEGRETDIVTQSSQALPLYFGMVPEEMKQDVEAGFIQLLKGRGAFAAGEVGLPYIIQAASSLGLNQLIAELIVKEEHPSYYAFVLDGETTLGEYWEHNPRSHAHDMMGHIIEWYYRGLAGIHPTEPGFKRVKISPFLPDGMNEFTCTYETPQGMIKVHACRKDGKPVFDVNLPAGITAE